MQKIIFAFTAILLLQPLAAQVGANAVSSEIFVDAAGKCEGKIPCYTSIQAAVDSVALGGIVRVYPGTYTEQIAIPKSLTLASTNGADVTVIQAPPMDIRKTISQTFPFGTRVVDYLLLLNNVDGKTTIDGFTIDGKNNGIVEGTYTGIYIADSDEVIIKNNTVKGFRDLSCEECINGAGIFVRSGAEETPKESRITEVTIENNLIMDYQKSGIIINESRSMAKLIKDNTIVGSGMGSSVAQDGIQIGFGASIAPEKMIQNTIRGNYHEAEGQELKLAIGILMLHADGTTAEDKTMYEQNNAVNDNQVSVAVIP